MNAMNQTAHKQAKKIKIDVKVTLLKNSNLDKVEETGSKVPFKQSAREPPSPDPEDKIKNKVANPNLEVEASENGSSENDSVQQDVSGDFHRASTLRDPNTKRKKLNLLKNQVLKMKQSRMNMSIIWVKLPCRTQNAQWG